MALVLFFVPWCLGGQSSFSYHGQVTFGGLPVPGATVTVAQGGKQFTTTTNQEGRYSFAELAAGPWTLEIQMTAFAPIKQDVAIGPNTAAGKWELKLLPLAEIEAVPPSAQAGTGHGVPPPAAPAEAATNPAPGAAKKRAAQGNATKGAATMGAATNNAAINGAKQSAAAGSGLKPGSTVAAESQPQTGELDQRAANGFLINGSVVNGAASPFAQAFAFGNNRSGGRGLYNGGLGLIFDNSALDARSYSLTGQNTPKPSYNRITAVATLGGPLKIPHIIPPSHAPNFFLAYIWTRYADDTTTSALVPTAAERGGDFSDVLNAAGQPVEIFNPSTGQPFGSAIIPPGQISPQAQALLNYYPLPSFSGISTYNYQVPIVTDTHQDALLSRWNENINGKNQLYGGFAFQSTRTATPNVFGFLDTSNALGINTNVDWSHRFSPGLFATAGFRFSRLGTRVKPYWEDRANVSGEAGIIGNNQDPMNWGPPALAFSSGLAGLTDGNASFNRNQTSAGSYSMLWSRNRHNITFGGDYRKQEFNYLAQQNPRGTFTFTGAATGDDFADFLLGVPDTSAVAFGNADKYFREPVYDAYITDDWRMAPQFTLNAGMRWDYGAPISELYGRLVNLDIASGFVDVAPVVATDPVGSLTGERYPQSLIRPDRRGFEPRVGIAWRPISGSSLLIRAGYGVYDDTSVYQNIAVQLAQQAPLSKSLSVQNSAACPLTLANGFVPCASITQENYAIDPNFRVGYAQNWDVSVQRDLPGSLQMTATYLGIKGTRGLQESLPNTYPIGAVDPCPSCPSGFTYIASNGNSTREAGQIQLRRRLHNGLTASARYTYSKSIDDDSALGGQGALLPSTTFSTSGEGGGSGGGGSSLLISAPSSSSSAAGPTIAQNWQNLRAERGLSSFDQRHLLNLQLQYTTGMGIGGKTLMSGWRGTAFKEWTVSSQFTLGSGLPESPVYLAATPGTGVTGSIRPDATGASIYSAPSGLHLNPAAYAAPLAGQWGTAGRNSITGPDEFGWNLSMGRTFRLDSRFNLDFRIDATNFLNHVTFTTWDTTIDSAQFGLPIAANAMRSMQATLRLRF